MELSVVTKVIPGRAREYSLAAKILQKHDVEVVACFETDSGVNRMLENVDKVVEVDSPAVNTARNIGAEAAEGDAVAFIDDDVMPRDGWADAVVSGLDEADAVGGPILPNWKCAKPQWLPRGFHWLIGCGPYYDERKLVPNTYASNIAVDRDAFLEVDGFNETVGPGGSGAEQGEEQLLGEALRNAGYNAVWYEPEAIVEHRVTAEMVRPARLAKRAVQQGRAKAEVGIGDRETRFIIEELSNADGPMQKTVAAALTTAVGFGYFSRRFTP